MRGFSDHTVILPGDSEIRVSDIKKAVREHPSVSAFCKQYESSFDGFDNYLKGELVQAINGVNISREEATLSDEIFRRLSDVPLQLLP